jgi:hypothetical protein
MRLRHARDEVASLDDDSVRRAKNAMSPEA